MNTNNHNKNPRLEIPRQRIGMAVSIASLLLAAAAGTSMADDTALTPVATFQFDFPAGYPTTPALNTDLSGLTWMGALPDGRHLYYSVSDKASNSVVPLTIDLNSATGAINSVEVSLPLTLRGANGDPLPDLDVEGIAFDITTGTVFVSNEKPAGFTGVAIRQFDAATLTLENEIVAGSSGTEFDVFTGIQGGFGLESCGVRKNGKAVWTTTQQRLATDDAPADDLTIRLQKLDRFLVPVAQYAYDLTPDPGVPDGFSAVDENNVHDLMILPNGTVISLELVIGFDLAGDNLNRLSLYEIDTTGATDLVGGSLAGAVRVGKRLLHQEIFDAKADPTFVEEFEGIALGPELENGDFSVILIADSGRRPRHALYAFRLSKGARKPSAD